nr:prolyl-tRNA synthetase associated domain-containing protein [Sphingosinicella soli]
MDLHGALAGLGISFTVHEHEAVFTVAESDDLHRRIAGAHTKNLFLKDEAGVFFLVTIPAEARANLKALPAVLGSRRLSFGKADDMERLLGITPGSVTPLAAFNDTARAVTVALDAGLAGAEAVNVHPLRNTATVGMSGPDLVRALIAWGHAPIIARIPVLEDK